MIDSNVVLGKNVKIFNHDLVNIFGCTIGDDTFVGPFVEITRGVTIGKRCKIESHSFICTAVRIEDDVFIGHGVIFTNDLYPRVDRLVEYLPTLVQKGASIGSNATIVGGVSIGEYAVIGAGSTVTKDVPSCSIVAGNPARIVKQFENYNQMLAYMTGKQPLQNSQ
jgi:UDP-2-acetamido-3-amino-2,3-dideoxy-glucuronate N-acetyltransferase